MQFESGTWPQLEEGLPPLAGLQTQGLQDSRGGDACYKPSRVQNLREAELERCLQHGDQQLSSSWAVRGPLYHGTKLALVAQRLPHCQFWESEPFLDSWCKWPWRELVQNNRAEYNCRPPSWQQAKSLPSGLRPGCCTQ